MNINLTPEQERIVQEELKAGHFRSVGGSDWRGPASPSGKREVCGGRSF
jgi:hypothetical protein